MEKTEIEKTVKDIIIDQFGLDEIEIKLESNLRSDLGIDSLDSIILIMECEKEFNLSINDEDADKIETFGQCVDHITKRLEL